MATKPSSTPQWNSSGGNNTEPSSGKKALGWVVNEAAASSYFNWFQKLTYEWLEYLKDGIFTGGLAVTGASNGVGVTGTGGSGNAAGVRGNGTGSGAGVIGVGAASGGTFTGDGSGVYGTTTGNTHGFGVWGANDNGMAAVRGDGTSGSYGGEFSSDDTAAALKATALGASNNGLHATASGAAPAVLGEASGSSQPGVKGIGGSGGSGVQGVGGTGGGVGVEGTGGSSGAAGGFFSGHSAGGVGVEGRGKGTAAGGRFQAESGQNAPGIVAVSQGTGTGADITAQGSGYGLVVQADTTSPARAALRLVPQNANPNSSPAAGDIFFCSADNTLRVYDGSTWQTLAYAP